MGDDAVTLISIACNHPDTGFFMGRFDAAHYGNDQDTEIANRHWGYRAGMGIRYLGNGRIRIAHRVFTFEREKEWFGNWCWNALWMRHGEARRLLRYLKDSKQWHCEGGPTRLYRWFNDGKPTTPRCKHGRVKAACKDCQFGQELSKRYVARWRARKAAARGASPT